MRMARRRIGGISRLCLAWLFVFAGACAPCGGEPASDPPSPPPSAGSALGTGEPAADAVDATVAIATERARLEPIGQLRASLVRDDEVIRATGDGTLRLDRLTSDGEAVNGWTMPLEDAEQVIDLRGSESGILVLRVERAPSVEQPPMSGSFTWIDTLGVAPGAAPTGTAAVDVPGVPSDAWVAGNGDVWVLARMGRQGELLRYQREPEAWRLADRIATEESPVRIVANPSGTRLAVPCFDGRSVQIVSVAARTVTRTIRVDVRPYAVTFSRDDLLLISSTNMAQVRVVDLSHDSDGQITTLSQAMPTWHVHEGIAFGAAAGGGALVRATLPFAEVVTERSDWVDASPVIGGLAMQGATLAVIDVGTPALRWVDASSLQPLADAPLASAASRWGVSSDDLIVVFHRDGAASRWSVSR